MCESISLRNTIIIEEEVMDLAGVGGTWEELEREEGGGMIQIRCSRVRKPNKV